MQKELSGTGLINGSADPVKGVLTNRLSTNLRFEDAAASVEAALSHLRQTEDLLARQLADLQVYINNNRHVSQAY
jgi:hypothetical protein